MGANGQTWRAARAGIVAAAFAALGATGCRTASAGASGAARSTPAPGSFAVVELFTSEGCSSCPPADAALRAIDAEGRRDGNPVYALSFHVDYWDGLGWKDPFSAPAFSERQRAYANAAGSDQVYTPQMIVNGTDSFNGADRGRARHAIDGALKRARDVRLALRIERDASDASVKADDGSRGARVVRYTIEGLPAGATLRVAEVAEARGHAIRSGENAGRTLEHAAVVRRFVSVPAAREGTVVLPAPSIAEDGGAPDAIVAFVQQPTMEIVAAARVDLPRR